MTGFSLFYDGADDTRGQGCCFAHLSAIPPNSHVKLLFFMGGNDSFLISQQQKAIHFTSFYTQLLTLIHESLHTVVRQARHLQLPILGIPLDCGCGETYLAHIEKGLDAMRQRVTGIERMTSVFGYLHLDHIRKWRDEELSKYSLEYLLWKTSYDKLMNDLETP
jgi:hypothetical protein